MGEHSETLDFGFDFASLTATLLGILAAVIIAVIFAILIHTPGPLATPAEPLPTVNIVVNDAVTQQGMELVDVYVKLYESEAAITGSDILMNGVRLRTDSSANGLVSIDPNLIGSDVILAIKVMDPHGYGIRDHRLMGASGESLSSDPTIMVIRLNDRDLNMHAVTLRLNMADLY
jgi:hypothetical protein